MLDIVSMIYELQSIKQGKAAASSKKMLSTHSPTPKPFEHLN